jgi:hypothetical protein
MPARARRRRLDSRCHRSPAPIHDRALDRGKATVQLMGGVDWDPLRAVTELLQPMNAHDLLRLMAGV